MAGLLAEPGKELTPDRMKSLGQGWARWPVRFHQRTADKAAAHLGPKSLKEQGLTFIKTDDGWKLDQWVPGA